jgi:alkanesulfonate monooxygenase SsuD/methylene tetrahydromethanopterin reductase-like flavin-dependent oxidoreductase (luciferase family)
MVGEIAEGWMTVSLEARIISDGIETIRASAAAVGRKFEQIYITTLTACRN